MQNSPGPLSGIKIVDFSHMRAGPMCTQMLGDMGAEIIKIEPPRGDGTRNFGNLTGGESIDFLSVNRNKKSVVLDLKQPRDLEVAHRLVGQADVVVENFRKGVMKRFGLDYETLAAKHEKLIYCTITAYGIEGPYADKPGYDQIAQGLSGFMSVTGTDETGPLRVGVPIGDMLGGVFAAYGIALALYERTISGKGQRVHTSLLRALVSMLSFHATRYTLRGELPTPVGQQHPIVVPTGTFKVKDGSITISCGTQEQWERLAAALGASELAQDPRYRTNRDRSAHLAEIVADIEARLASRTRAEWIDILEQHDVPAGPVNTIADVVKDPQVIADQLIIAAEQGHPTIGPVPMPGFSVMLERTPPSARTSPPTLGQHTDEILRSLLRQQNAD